MLTKNKMSTRAIDSRLNDLTNSIQLLFSHLEQLKPAGTAKQRREQQQHIKEMKAAIKDAVRIIHKMHNLAAIDLDES